MAPSSIVSWDRLVRYVSAGDGKERYGEPTVNSTDFDIAEAARSGELEVGVLEGDNPLNVQRTNQTDRVKTLLGPLREQDVPIIRCIGLNYKSHIKETGRALPEVPTVFTKPAPAVADHDVAIPIPKLAQQRCDYEGELTILIGRNAKDVSAADALEFVAGYTVGNDVSARDWQREANKAGVVPQWCFSKSFDKYAPLGPVIVSTKLLGAANDLELTTWVNGEGQTLQKGSLIMTGTPGGVGLFMKPPNFLKDGDVVEVEISGVGKLRNSMKFL
ncbi:hypothetical protein LTR95_003050 [Oleoguttula sp. CCFEE 5521]